MRSYECGSAGVVVLLQQDTEERGGWVHSEVVDRLGQPNCAKWLPPSYHTGGLRLLQLKGRPGARFVLREGRGVVPLHAVELDEGRRLREGGDPLHGRERASQGTCLSPERLRYRVRGLARLAVPHPPSPETSILHLILEMVCLSFLFHSFVALQYHELDRARKCLFFPLMLISDDASCHDVFSAVG